MDPSQPTTGDQQQICQGSSGQSAQEHQTKLDSTSKDAGDGISELNDAEKAQFVIENRARLIQSVSTVMAIVDSLGSMVHRELYTEIEAATTRQKQMRLVFVNLLDPGGKAVRAAFYNAIKQHEPQLSTTEKPEAQCKRELKTKLTKKLLLLSEWITNEGQTTFLHQIYTEVYITKGGSGEVNKEHEIRQIEAASRTPARPETSIKSENIFKALPGDEKPVRTVMTKGVAGIGKTVQTQKYALDWAEDKANQDIHFVFPFTFRELNLEKDEYSLEGLLQKFFIETKNLGICIFNTPNVVFIFDGLDECRPPLHFRDTVIWTDPKTSTTLAVLLTNLIRGNLLPKANIWITTRPAAADQIPSDYVDRYTEVKGFDDNQKREYFFKRFSDEQQASEIYSHIQTSRSLHIMCHIPVFCWITARVMGEMLNTEETLPKTQTTMYIHYMLIQSIQKNAKYLDLMQKHPDRNPNDAILSLGKLAFEQLKKGQLIFYEKDLTASGIDIEDAAVYSEVFTQLFGKVCGEYNDKVFSFVHLSIQEFLAALHVFITFINTGDNLLSTSKRYKLFGRIYKSKIHHLYQSAVKKAIQSPDGHLDLFLRFLLGLCLDTNQKLLQRLLTQKEKSFKTKPTVKYIKKKIGENPSPESSVNLFHCLNELKDHSLEKDIQQYVTSGHLSKVKLSPAQWSALVFILLSSEKELIVFELKKYSASEEALLELLPVLKASNKALLSGCNLSESCCHKLSSALCSSSSLREVDLSNNDLLDSGVNLLAVGLGSPHCLLETLKLSGCKLSENCCQKLSSAVSSSFTLREVDLSNNDLLDSGINLLAVGLRSPHCMLKSLKLSGCKLSENCCQELSSAVSSSSSLREVDLSNNDLLDSGVNLLAVGLGSPNCMLETLNLSGCLVTEKGCSSLTSALRSNPSHLRELNLSYNHPGESGEAMLSAVVKDPHYRLDTLSVDHGGESMLTPGLKKYVCELTLDPNTAYSNLSLSKNNKKVTLEGYNQKYPPHPDRFMTSWQVMCRESLTGRCYWEADWERDVYIAVTYRSINREGEDSWFGSNNLSWCLNCDGNSNRYTVSHNKEETVLPVCPSSHSGRVSVYVDCPAGTLSFYTVSSDTLTHLYTFRTSFTEPLCAGFWCPGSVSLCV